MRGDGGNGLTGVAISGDPCGFGGCWTVSLCCWRLLGFNSLTHLVRNQLWFNYISPIFF